MSIQVSQLVQAAQSAAAQGRFAEAEGLWRKVAALDPRHPGALFSLAVHAFQRGDLAGAKGYLETAHHVAPQDANVLTTLAVVLRAQGDGASEWAAISAALAADPYFLPAMLAKAAYQERTGKVGAAATMYRHCLRVAPPRPHWPASLQPQLAHAAVIVEAQAQAFAAHLEAALGPARSALPASAQGQWREAASIMAGLTKPYLSDSNQLYVPRLPAIPFFDRSHFPWAEALEAETDAIRAELESALALEGADFTPYIAYRPGDPVNQWDELNHSTRWSTYQLYRAGVPDEAHLARCPRTAAALAQVEVADIGGLCPNAMFSALAPHTEIPPHHGETNARLVVHLPLIVPDNCLYRVGFETRRWRVGEILAFDDTLEHAARNDSDALRVVLIFDVWNPLLTPAERDVVRAMAEAARTFHRD